MRAAGHTFVIPAIADYETRRELLRGGSGRSLAAHDTFCGLPNNVYLSISDDILRHAGELWAQDRNMGKPTSGEQALDGDVILCAQVLEANYPAGTYSVATTNAKHLSLFVDAAAWPSIIP